MVIHPRWGRRNGWQAVFPAFEALMDSTPDRQIKPFLAKTVDINPKDLTITFHQRQGIKFHDGSELDAEAVAFNFHWQGKAGTLQYWDRVVSLEILDPLTIRLHLTEYNNMTIHSLGWLKVISKQALTTKKPAWLRGHPVGTGPFRLAEWKKGSYLRWERNPDYWQLGKPYLDAIEIRFVCDPMTASMMMINKEADVWLQVPVNQLVDLEKKGMIRSQWFAESPVLIFLNTKDADRPTSKLKVREAIEYALDKKIIAQAVGQGNYSPIQLAVAKGEWGDDPGYQGRSYDPAKARQLLINAGYTLPVKLKLMAMGTEWSTAIKSHMDRAGFDVDIDVADPSRFFASMFKTGWQDMLMFYAGPDINQLVTFQRWFGHESATNLASFKRSPELLALSREAITYPDAVDQQAITKKLMRLLADEADVIPLWSVPVTGILQPYVHFSYMKEPFRWRVYDDWMDEH